MIISKQNDKESEKVSQLIKLVDNIKPVYVDTETDIIAKQQPFLLSMLLGYNLDLKENELEEIMKVIFLIWEYFKDSKSIKKTMISEEQFEKVQESNVYMLKYLKGEQGAIAQFNLVASDFNNLDSKVLFAGIFFQFKNKKSFLDMNDLLRGQLIIGMKSLIECFEEIIKGKRKGSH